MRLSDVGETLAEWSRLLLVIGTAIVLVLLWGGDAIRPGSLQRAGLRNVKPLPTPVWFMAGVLVLLTPVLIYSSVAKVEWVVGGSADALRASAAPQGIAYLAGITVALGLVLMAQRAAPEAGLKLDWIDLPVGVGLLLLASPIVLLMGDLAVLVHESLAAAPESPIAHPLLSKMVENRSDPWTWVLVASAVVGAPVTEEIVYRVFVQSGLLRLTNHAWVSLIVTAAIFGTVHAIGPAATALPWYAALQVGVLGLCCGAAFERTKRLGVPIAMHAAFNAANIAVAMWTVGGA